MNRFTWIAEGLLMRALGVEDTVASRPGGCGCACTSGGHCGGCGHRGCGG